MAEKRNFLQLARSLRREQHVGKGFQNISQTDRLRIVTSQPFPGILYFRETITHRFAQGCECESRVNVLKGLHKFVYLQSGDRRQRCDFFRKHF